MHDPSVLPPLHGNNREVREVHAHTHLTDAAVGGKDDDGREAGLEGAIEVCEALNVQHVHLVDEQHARHQLCHSLVYVPVHHLRGHSVFRCMSDWMSDWNTFC